MDRFVRKAKRVSLLGVWLSHRHGTEEEGGKLALVHRFGLAGAFIVLVLAAFFVARSLMPGFFVPGIFAAAIVLPRLFEMRLMRARLMFLLGRRRRRIGDGRRGGAGFDCRFACRFDGRDLVVIFSVRRAMAALLAIPPPAAAFATALAAA